MKFLKAFTIVLSLCFPVIAFAQGSGQLQAGQVWGNPTASAKPATGASMSAMLSQSICATRGSIVTLTASAWTCLTPGTSGLPLLSGGAGADLSYAKLALGSLAVGTQDTVIGYWGSTAASAIAMNNCSSALTYNTGTHVFGCNTLAGTGTVTSVAAGTGMSFSTITGTGSVAIDPATNANFFSGAANKVVTSGVIYQAETTTTFGATTTFDFSTFTNTVVTLTGNITTMTFSNVIAGKAGSIRFIQDGSGNHTTVWNSILKWPAATAPALSTAINAVDVLNYNCVSATFCQASLTKGSG